MTDPIKNPHPPQNVEMSLALTKSGLTKKKQELVSASETKTRARKEEEKESSSSPESETCAEQETFKRGD